MVFLRKTEPVCVSGQSFHKSCVNIKEFSFIAKVCTIIVMNCVQQS